MVITASTMFNCTAFADTVTPCENIAGAQPSAASSAVNGATILEVSWIVCDQPGALACQCPCVMAECDIRVDCGRRACCPWGGIGCQPCNENKCYTTGVDRTFMACEG